MSHKGLLSLMIYFSICFIFFFIFFIIFDWQENDARTQQTLYKEEPQLILYPIEDKKEVKSNLTFSLTRQKGEHYRLHIKGTTKANPTPKLVQDLSLVYSNGRLIEKRYGYQEESAFLEQRFVHSSEGSHRYDVISFHHALFEDNKGELNSGIHLSADQVYVLSSAFQPTLLFHRSQTNTQKQWQRILDHAISEQWRYHWQYLLSFFQIESNQYEIIPLNQLNRFYQEKMTPTSHFQKPSQFLNLLGRIWEDIYVYYYIGQQAHTDSLLNTQGSSMPVILISKNGSGFKILFRASDGQEVMIERNISP
jgi:hypothetical protein